MHEWNKIVLTELPFLENFVSCLPLDRGRLGRMAVADRVGRLYRNALRDLTFNSKPIINNLTMLAQEHAKEATSIVQVLLNHLQTVQPVSNSSVANYLYL